jgi:hypothetical protein
MRKAKKTRQAKNQEQFTACDKRLPAANVKNYRQIALEQSFLASSNSL